MPPSKFERSKAGLREELATAVAFLRDLEWGTEHRWCDYCCRFADEADVGEDGALMHKPDCELAAFLRRVEG